MSTDVHTRFRAVILASVASAAILLAGCGGAASDTVASGASDTSSSDAPAPAGPAAAQVVGLVGGGQIDLNSIEGTDTVLWFWAPW